MFIKIFTGTFKVTVPCFSVHVDTQPSQAPKRAHAVCLSHLWIPITFLISKYNKLAHLGHLLPQIIMQDSSIQVSFFGNEKKYLVALKMLHLKLSLRSNVEIIFIVYFASIDSKEILTFGSKYSCKSCFPDGWLILTKTNSYCLVLISGSKNSSCFSSHLGCFSWIIIRKWICVCVWK